ncbi:MAG: uridine kinase [Ignavibacteriales bacterium]|nr:uridine kinase [Ignavibacteriales bacterium]
MEHPLIIGIAGGTGSGKTTVTHRIIEKLDRDKIVVFEHDSYYKDLSAFNGQQPEEINFDHPNALETSLLIEHIKLLRQRVAIQQPIYDFKTYKRLAQTKLVSPKSVIIVEGILLFVEKELRDLMDIKLFVDTDADERLLRRLQRDIVERSRSIESVMHQYIETVKPMHLEFVEPSKRWADIIIPKGGENFIAIETIAARINSMLRK